MVLIVTLHTTGGEKLITTNTVTYNSNLPTIYTSAILAPIHYKMKVLDKGWVMYLLWV